MMPDGRVARSSAAASNDELRRAVVEADSLVSQARSQLASLADNDGVIDEFVADRRQRQNLATLAEMAAELRREERAGGPNLLAIGDGRVVVIDRTGAVIGRGTYSGESPIGAVPTMHPSPTGTRWAWTMVTTVPAPGVSTAGPHASSLWVAGLAEPPHRVRTWTGEYDVASRQWSDAGIVVVKFDYRCGELPQSSALVDPPRVPRPHCSGPIAGRWTSGPGCTSRWTPTTSRYTWPARHS
jgi:hypothetical protein